MSSVSLSHHEGYNSTQVERVFQEHSDFLMSVLLRSLPEQDALDVFQNLCLKAMTNGFPSDVEDIRAYLYRTAKNAVIDYHRKSTIYEKKVQEYSQRKPKKADNDPAKEVMRFNLLMKTFDMIEKRLAPSISKVFIGKYQNNLTHCEIAKEMNITKSTVDRYLSVGTKQIHELYEELFGDSNE